MWADLHVHSCRSDGSQSVGKIFSEAVKRGLTHISITDHDTLSHLPEVLAAGQASGIRIVAGIEISAGKRDKDGNPRKVHILGYGFEKGSSIEGLCRPTRQARHLNTLNKLHILTREGYGLSEKEVLAENGNPEVLYKQHLMVSLINRKYEEEGRIYGRLYRQLFKNGGICSGDITYPEAEEAVRAVKEDGGLAVLAHPGLEDLYDLVPGLVDAGLDGIEYYHESHNLSDHRKILSLADKYRLFLTGGSDTHGKLGSVHPLGGITAPFDVFESPLSERFC